jgi:hypothetical protein
MSKLPKVKLIDDTTTMQLDRVYKKTATFFFAQVLGVLILTLLAFFLAGKIQPFGAASGEASFSIENLTNPNAAIGSAALTTFLWIAILALAVGVFLLRRVLFAPATLRDAAVVGGSNGLLKSLQTKIILLVTIAEIVAILGFIISLTSGNWTDMLRAALVAAVLFFINFPRKSVWQKLADNATRVQA